MLAAQILEGGEQHPRGVSFVKRRMTSRVSLKNNRRGDARALSLPLVGQLVAVGVFRQQERVARPEVSWSDMSK